MSNIKLLSAQIQKYNEDGFINGTEYNFQMRVTHESVSKMCYQFAQQPECQYIDENFIIHSIYIFLDYATIKIRETGQFNIWKFEIEN